MGALGAVIILVAAEALEPSRPLGGSPGEKCNCLMQSAPALPGFNATNPSFSALFLTEGSAKLHQDIGPTWALVSKYVS